MIFIRHENPPQVRMLAKPNAHHIEDLPLHKFGAPPDIRHGIHFAVMLRNPGLHTDPVPLSNGIHLVHHFKTLFLIRPVNGTDVDHIVKIHCRVIMEKSTDLVKMFPSDRDRQIPPPFFSLNKPFGKLRLDPCGQMVQGNSLHGDYTLTCFGCFVSTRFRII